MVARQQSREPGSQAGGEQLTAPPLGSRLAAASALAVSALTLAFLVVFTARDLAYVLGSVAAGSLGISALWIAATNHRFRLGAAVSAIVLVAAAVASLVMVGRGAVAVVTVIIGITVASALGTLALRWEVHQAIAERWHEVPATRHGVVLMNQKSGNGKIAKLHLIDEARRRGIEPVLLERGGNLRALAEAAVARGADALGIAGGDGSQAVVAEVAASHGLPFVCVPAGTRNHLASDLGIDRRHPARALDAFGAAREATMDLGEVNGEVFVNNVSLGLYASIVASQKYREAKRRTVAEMLPDLLGPRAKPFDLVVDGPDGAITNAQVVQISNNPYVLSSVNGFGSRFRLDGGVLGIATLTVNGPSDINRLVALEAAGHPERYQGWRDWTTTNLEVRGPSMFAAAVDGEARIWTTPLHFAVRPGALRVRVSLDQRGASPAFLRAPVAVSTLLGLARVVGGYPSGIVAKEAKA
ncbi:MAG: diacylglycerol kinase family protein [Acidimicrobiales bacterium]